MVVGFYCRVPKFVRIEQVREDQSKKSRRIALFLIHKLFLPHIWTVTYNYIVIETAIIYNIHIGRCIWLMNKDINIKEESFLYGGMIMELNEQTNTMGEKNVDVNAGAMLNDNELDMVSGGDDIYKDPFAQHKFICDEGHIFTAPFPCLCPSCGSPRISVYHEEENDPNEPIL